MPEGKLQRTLSIIKPDAFAKKCVGDAIRRFESEGFRILAMKTVRMDEAGARGFYAVHRGRPFFDSLCAFMSSGPAVVLALEGEDVIRRLRDLMGPTDPAKAAEGTLRKAFGTNIERNAFHGSDSEASAAIEIPYFFSSRELGVEAGA